MSEKVYLVPIAFIVKGWHGYQLQVPSEQQRMAMAQEGDNASVSLNSQPGIRLCFLSHNENIGESQNDVEKYQSAKKFLSCHSVMRNSLESMFIQLMINSMSQLHIFYGLKKDERFSLISDSQCCSFENLMCVSYVIVFLYFLEDLLRCKKKQVPLFFLKLLGSD